ncbi:hypothetical protein CEXT_375571 [Caerostris extrusa]|uniref:Uncharacterized protein n=1 Tax=Caerostris extrusa TaxID=172846 RepID=A0AAV4U3A8_CAEEX|nr:hypothetical protein CEXT_375571 [Caerostris extrusa]
MKQQHDLEEAGSSSNFSSAPINTSGLGERHKNNNYDNSRKKNTATRAICVAQVISRQCYQISKLVQLWFRMGICIAFNEFILNNFLFYN